MGQTFGIKKRKVLFIILLTPYNWLFDSKGGGIEIPEGCSVV